MTYQTFIDRLSRRGLFRIRPGLDRVRRVLHTLGNPQDAISVIHIAGTNGKGSVAAALESVLRQAGFSTGLYTSPHLQDVRERIQLDRRLIARDTFWEMAQDVLATERQTGLVLTYFEFLTVMAFLTFKRQSVDVAVIETGMGGRWDATNVVTHPVLTFITSIGLDHTPWLGKTEAAIAREKAGIIKAGSPIICGARGTVAHGIAGVARSRNAPFYSIDQDFSAEVAAVNWENGQQSIRYKDASGAIRYISIALLGNYQVDNMALVLAGLDLLEQEGWEIDSAAIRRGLTNVTWPGRFQVSAPIGKPITLFDGAHNPPAMRRFLEALNQSPWRKASKTFVFSAYKDKDVRAMLELLRPHAQRIIFCTLPGSRALPAKKIAALWKDPSTAHVVRDPRVALQRALQNSQPNDLVAVTGSLSLVGRLYKEPTSPVLEVVHV